MKPYHLTDCALQAWVRWEAGPLERVSLAHVDNSFVRPGGERYDGLPNTMDVTAETVSLIEQVPARVRDDQTALSGGEPQEHCALDSWAMARLCQEICRTRRPLNLRHDPRAWPRHALRLASQTVPA